MSETQPTIILHSVDCVDHEGYHGNGTNASETLDKYDEQTLAKMGFIEAWYWYQAGSYDGCGQIIAKNADGMWQEHDMGHCSCYGPLDHMSNAAPYATLDALLAACSKEHRRDVEALVAAARKDGAV